MLRRNLSLRSAHIGLAKTQADGQLSHSRLTRHVGKNAIERQIEIDECQ
jgi:hypothetical protein